MAQIKQTFTAGPAQASFPGGKDGVKQAGFQHQFEEGSGRGAAEVLEQLVPHPGRGAGPDQVPFGQDLPPGRGVDAKADAGRMAQHPQHTHRVAYEAHRRVADHPDAAGLQVFHAIDEIHQGKVADVVKQGVDGQVPALGVLRRGAEGVVLGGRGVLVLDFVEFRTAPEGGDLDDVAAPKKDLDQPEALADDAAVAEEFAQFPGPGVSDHVEILGLSPQEQVPDPAAHQIGSIAGVEQPIEDLQGLQFDIFPGDGVLWPGNDEGLGNRWFGGVKPHLNIITEIPQFFNPLINNSRRFQAQPSKIFQERGNY